MKKTIKQRFFLSLCLLMLFSLFGGGNLAWAGDVTIKPDKTWTAASNRTTKTVSGVTFDFLGGSAKPTYYSDGLRTYEGCEITISSEQLISKIVFTYTIKNSGSLKLQTTTGTWDSSTKTWTGSADAVSFKVGHSSGKDNGQVKITKIVVTTDDSPILIPSISELSFGKVETSSNKPQSFILSGRNLTENATLSITGTDKGSFSVDPASISQEGGTIAAKEVTVTYTPTAVGSHTATLTIASSGATTKEIALSGTGIAPLPTYNVSWMVDGASYTDGTPSTSVKEGESVTALPTEPAAIGTKKFVGWTNAEIAADQSTAPDVLFTTPENAPAVTGNITYYAVFATEAMGSSAWKRIKTLTDITDGSYVIKNANYILPNTNTTSKDAPTVVAAPAISGETITGKVDASMIWNFTTTGKANQFYVQNADENYLYEINDNDGIRVGSTSDKWTFAVNTADYFSMKGANKSRYCATYKAQDWRSYTSATHSNYNNGGKLELYKLTIEKSYSDYCTTLPVQLAVGETGYATLYYSNYDLVVPANTEAYTFRSSNGALMESKTYAEGTVIPAGEAVVVYTINTVPCTLNFKKGIATADCDPSSQLAGTDEATAITPNADYYFYGLSLNSKNDPNSVGFYWMNDTGAAFTNGAHKAYLKILKSEFTGQAVRGFAFKGTTTGVESVESSNNAPQAIYDLTGRRVSKAEKGIYIINGKKVIK